MSSLIDIIHPIDYIREAVRDMNYYNANNFLLIQLIKEIRDLKKEIVKNE